MVVEQLAGLFGHASRCCPPVDPISCAAIWLRSASLRNFGRDHREALAVLAGACRFNRSVQGQQVGLVGDVVDDADLAGNLTSWPRRCLLTAVPPSIGFGGDLVAMPVGDLGIVGVLR
jgi:hypothetical protein